MPDEPMTREKWIDEFNTHGMKRIENAIRNCDPKFSIYMLSAEEIIEIGTRSRNRLLTPQDISELKDNVRSSYKKFNDFCECRKRQPRI